MPRARLFRPCVFAVVLLFIVTDFSIAQRHSGTYHGRKAVENEVLVKFRQVSTGTLAKIDQQYDLSSRRPLGGVRLLYRLRSRSKKIAELVSGLSARPDVVYAEPNFELHAIELPNDPQFSNQWSLQNTGQASSGFAGGTPGADISAVSAWDISTGSTAHVIGVVDTGIDYTHPDLQANIWAAPTAFTITLNGVAVTCPAGAFGYNAIVAVCDPMDDNMHGTHVSGTIGAAGNNNIGVVGVNWTAQIMGLKFLDSDGYGYTADAITAMEFAIQVKTFFSSTNTPADVRIFSNSWGGGDFSQALQDEVDQAAQNDILFVAAAGNSSVNIDQSPMYPASFNRPNMIAVAATDNNDALAPFSNYGPNSVHLGAPGVNILSTLPGSSYGYLSGTSMATPHVSGAAALMLSACTLSTADLKKNLLDNVDPTSSLSGMTITGGRLNVNRAIRSCNGPVGVSPSAISFGTVVVGNTSNPQTVTLTNYQTSTLNISSVLASGDFAQTNTCGNALASQARCTISVTLTPTATGAENGRLQIFDDAGNSPQSAVLSGTGALNIDLVASTSVSAQVSYPGSVITVNSTVLNQGTAGAGASVAGIYLSLTGMKDASAVPVGSFGVPALSGGSSFPAQTGVTIPANLALGSYYVLTCADDSNLVVETNEANNCGATASAIQIQAAPLPDLVERGVSFVQANSMTLQITETVMNQGTANAGASITQFYFSPTSSRDASARQLIGARSISALAAGTSSQGTTTATIQQNMPGGSYYLLACADDTSLVQESNENNNCSAASARVAFLADLIEFGVSTPTGSTSAGATIIVTDTTTNQGVANAAASVTQYFLSPYTSKTASARLLGGSRAVPALPPGGIAGGSTSVTVPPDMAAGNFYLLACADDTNLVPESSESNNCAAAASKIQVGPDLVESAVSSQTQATGAGATITVSDTVTNQGAGNAGASFTQYYFSPYTTKTANAVLLAGNRPVPALAAGASSPGSASVTVPQNMAAGSFYILACADDTNLVPESMENNNCAASATKIQVGPDFVESGVGSQVLSTAAGASITVSDTATNQGSGNAGASFTQYYLSAYTTKNANARLLARSRSIPALAAGGSSAGSTVVTLPSDMAAGSFYLLACADDTNLVPESNENNNCAASTTKIGVGPDLVESAVSSQTLTTTAGGTIAATDTVTNKGGGDAGASLTQYYLSPYTNKNANAVLLGGSRSLPALPSNTSSNGSVTLAVPANMPSGTFYFLACADDTAMVAESNENNNCAAASARIKVGP